MTDLTPEQRADRERARLANGEFGTHDHSGPELALDGNTYSDLSAPLTVTVRLERWDERDNAIPVGHVEFDARALFDARDLASIDPETTHSDEDWVFDEARAAGIVKNHDGPFTVQLPDDFEEYLEHRRDNGMVDAYPSAAESLAIQVRETKLAQRQESLEAASRLLHEAGEGATITKKVSDFDEDGEILVQGTSRVAVHNIEHSSTMPGFMAVETDFGTLYLDPDQEFEVEAD